MNVPSPLTIPIKKSPSISSNSFTDSTDLHQNDLKIPENYFGNREIESSYENETFENFTSFSNHSNVSKQEKRIIHGLVCFQIHGMEGSEIDFRQFDKSLHSLFPTLTKEIIPFVPNLYLRSLRSNVNKNKTSDGVQRLGRRVAKELVDTLKQFPQGIMAKEPFTDDDLIHDTLYNIYIAMVGHSMGGIIARNALRYLLLGGDQVIDFDLYNKEFDVNSYDYILDEFDVYPGKGWNDEDTFSGLEKWFLKTKNIRVKIIPMSYISIATPHLGIRRSSSNGKLSLNNMLRVASTRISRSKFKLTGKELLLRDDDQILSKMNDLGPWNDSLNMFPLKTLIASCTNDIVPFCSAQIRTVNPFIQDHEVMLKRGDVVGAKIVGHLGFHQTSKDSLYQTHLFNHRDLTNCEEVPALEEVDALGLSHEPTNLLPLLRRVSTKKSRSPSPLSTQVFKKQSSPIMPETPMTPSIQNKPLDLISDSHSTLEFSSCQMSNLQKTFFRRISIRLDYPSQGIYAIPCTHPHMCGVKVAAVPKDVQNIGKDMANFGARLVILDFIYTMKNTLDC